ncbi:hypothetical protein S2091_0649 [Solimicrobium silvestre]|uniref:Surface-adhesin protein E-like domain-containing protein n=2 Tax=Solimicrobium silvestre TaxID=2099400 RepID=A0A2S9H450_9BURK|nr:hypothetical protein S2091_0649 [Solimicrobium silvestre]
MRKLFALLFLIFSSQAFANWDKVSSVAAFSNDEGNEYYWDLSTLRQQGHTFKIWTMLDTKSPTDSNFESGKKVQSVRKFIEIDCVEKNQRMLSYVENAGLGGTGATIYSESITSPWNPFTPHSWTDFLYQKFCRKQK